MQKIDLTGKRFGRLIVLKEAEKNARGQMMWHCICDCGNHKNVLGSTLRNGGTTSCGCLAREQSAERCRIRCKGKQSPRRKDLAGMRFGRLLVVKLFEETCSSGKLRWVCQCDCGKTTITATGKLTSGRTKSCGCLGLENATKAKIKHSDTHSRLYYIWSAMKRRCYNKNVDTYKYYGGKGIKICKEWLKYTIFKKWAINNGYNDNLTIDRIDSNDHYCPENCRWITLEENISRAKKIDDIKELSIIDMLKKGFTNIEIAKKLNISPDTITSIKKRNNIQLKNIKYPKALKELVICMKKNGVSTKEILDISGVSDSAFYTWMKQFNL